MITETLPKPTEIVLGDIHTWNDAGLITPQELAYTTRLAQTLQAITPSKPSADTIPPTPYTFAVSELSPSPDTRVSPKSPKSNPDTQPEKRMPNYTLTPREQEIVEFLLEGKRVRSSIEKAFQLTKSQVQTILNVLKVKLPHQELPQNLINLSPTRQEGVYTVANPEEAAKIAQAQEDAHLRDQEASRSGGRNGHGEHRLIDRDGIFMGDELPTTHIKTIRDEGLPRGMFAPVRDSAIRISAPKIPMILVEGPLGLFHIKRKDSALFEAVQAGIPQDKIIQQLFHGNATHYHAGLESLNEALSIHGLRTSIQNGTVTIEKSIVKEETPTPKKAEVQKKYITLTPEDIRSLTKNPLSTDQFLPIDLDLLQTLMTAFSTGRTIELDLFDHIIDPHNKIPASTREALIRMRLRKLDRFLEHENMLQPKKAKESLTRAIQADTVFAQPTFRMRRKDDRTKKSVIMVLQRTDGEITSPIEFQPLGKNTITAIADAAKNGISVKHSEKIGEIRAADQTRLFEILFQNDPVQVSFIHSRLGMGVDTKADLGNVLRTVDEKIHAWGLGIKVFYEDGEEKASLTPYIPDTHRVPRISKEILDLTKEKAELPTRQRRRNPTHAKIRL